MNAVYELASVTWDESEIEAMNEVIQSGKFTMGSRVEQFENEFANYFGSKYAVMSNSGSSANLLALAAMRYRQGNLNTDRDEVIVPAVSWSTTYFPVHQLGYKLRFVDVDLGTLNFRTEDIVANLSEKTAGIFAVNLLGNPSDLAALRRICDERGIFFLEDNCESMGASLDGKAAGTFGDIGTFSTYFSHHISTMEGGMSLTDDLHLAELMRSMRAHGWVRGLPTENTIWNKSGNRFEDAFKFILPGYNLRPLELSGAIGSQQLKKFDQFLSVRRENAILFKSKMSNLDGFIFQTENGASSWFGFSIILSGRNQGRRSELVANLEGAGIECRPIVAGNFTKNPVIRHLMHVPIGPVPNAEYLDENGLFVGNHHYPMDSQISLLHEVLTQL